jgi:hypothetical protein
MKPGSWEVNEGTTKFADHNGVAAMEMSGDLAVAKNVDFTNGTIEFDLEFVRGFVGIYFRRQDNAESEFFYLRDVTVPETSIDAIQYAPIVKKVNLWDVYPEYQTGASFRKGEWTHIKMVVSGAQMVVYVNDKSKPTLVIPKLEGNTKHGGLAFEGNCFVSNLVVKPNEVGELNPTEGFDPTFNDIRYIRNWQVSQPMPLPTGQEVNNSNMPDIQTQWEPIAAERLGFINLTRLFGQSDSRRYVWLRTKIVSQTVKKVKVNFGFSDEVWVFINDRTSYVDKNLYGQGMRKSPNGRISIENSTFELQLNQGENDLVIGLANDFYGWGIIARLEDLDGLSLNTNYAKEEINKDFEKYFGTYSSKQIPVKIKVSQKNGKLSLLPTAESPLLLVSTGVNTFKGEQADFVVEFFPAENKFTFRNGTVVYEFLRD